MNLKYKVTILVEPTYLEDHSDPAEDSYLWAYTVKIKNNSNCLLYTSPSPRDRQKSRMPSSA